MRRVGLQGRQGEESCEPEEVIAVSQLLLCVELLLLSRMRRGVSMMHPHSDAAQKQLGLRSPVPARLMQPRQGRKQQQSSVARTQAHHASAAPAIAAGIATPG